LIKVGNKISNVQIDETTLSKTAYLNLLLFMNKLKHDLTAALSYMFILSTSLIR